MHEADQLPGDTGSYNLAFFQSVELAGNAELASCMGECFRGVEAADLALGKPCLSPLLGSATVAHALKALRHSKDIGVLLWVERSVEELYEQSALSNNGGIGRERFRCGALVTVLDIICFLASDENLYNPAKALSSPLSALYPCLSQAVEHVDGQTRLCSALNLMLLGVQHLVVPITKRKKKGKLSKLPVPIHAKDVPVDDFCWITQEDVLRYLLGCVGMFYPLPMMSLQDLDMINEDVLLVDENAEAISAVPLIKRASQEATAVAVVSCQKGSRPKLVGDISIQTMRDCNEMAAEALATLSMKDFLYFVNDCPPPQFLVEKVYSKLKSKALVTNRNLASKHPSSLSKDFASSASPASVMASGMARVASDLGLLSEPFTSDEDLSGYSSSSDEDLPRTPACQLLELSSVLPVVKMKSRRNVLSKATTLITCRPRSSLVAVMAQALAHRVNHVWITDDEGGLVGIVTYSDIIDVLLSQIHSLD
ncbi:hypothetical protein R1flu_027422 [Riccia fluitans]|uniref:CBS domain-containing protein n=1 Tax=Riccia fluitans TaxID=41844 RepID=A0ABD1XJA7_9MARC